MKYITKKEFNVIMYDNKTFTPIPINFELKKYYNVENENHTLIIINKSLFYKRKEDVENTGYRYLYDYFYTKQEERKLKLQKINDN